MTNGRTCIQVHGGMGFTWEVPAHLAYKRARVLATPFGTDGALAESLAELAASHRALTDDSCEVPHSVARHVRTFR